LQSNAVTQVLPLPANGSSTSSPSNVKLRISGARAAMGFCVGCSLLQLYGFTFPCNQEDQPFLNLDFFSFHRITSVLPVSTTLSGSEGESTLKALIAANAIVNEIAEYQ
jgi:hypothetical protein